MIIRRWISLVLIMGLIMMGACGCMTNNAALNRKETDAEYSALMLDYVRNKYNKDFTVIETFFPKEGFNTSMKVNTLVVQEAQSGMIVNVYAVLGAPYDFYDDYVSALAGHLSKDRVNTSGVEDFAESKLYIHLKEKDVNNINVSDENIVKATLVINVTEKPTETILRGLFEVYEQLSTIDGDYIFMIVGFTEEKEIFAKYVNNYSHYGDKQWEDYTGDVYATMNISEKGLTYAEFVNNVRSVGD